MPDEAPSVPLNRAVFAGAGLEATYDPLPVLRDAGGGACGVHRLLSDQRTLRRVAGWVEEDPTGPAGQSADGRSAAAIPGWLCYLLDDTRDYCTSMRSLRLVPTSAEAHQVKRRFLGFSRCCPYLLFELQHPKS